MPLSHRARTRAVVFNIKSQESRLLELIPSDSWGGAGLLGVTIRLDDYAGAEDRLIRVLEVEDRSPAAVAGLVPYKDYLLGTTTVSLDSSETLAALLRSHEDRVIELYVYNVDSDVVRVVALMPTLSWGGRGLLGAAVGTGYLHRLPSHARHTEGASIERKVRYIGVAATPTKSSNITSGGGSRGDDATDASRPGVTVIPTLGSSRTIVELVPQMEMEHDEDDEDDENGPDASEELSSVALSVDENSSTASPRAAGTVVTQQVSARGVQVETVAAEYDDDNDGRPEDRAPKRPVREASGRHWEDAGRGGGVAATAAAERRDRPPTQPSDSHTIPEVHTLGALESRKRCGSADELFALPEAPASPVPTSPPPGVRQPSASSSSYASPTSYANALPPPPKMHYHA